MLGAACGSLQPRFAAVLYEARQKIAARNSVLIIDRGERRNRAASAGLGVFPRHAAPALAQHFAHGSAGDGEIAFSRQFRRRSRRRRGKRVGLIGALLLRKRGVEVVGKAAAGARERPHDEEGRRTQTSNERAAGRSSITGLPEERAWRQRHHPSTPQNV